MSLHSSNRNDYKITSTFQQCCSTVSSFYVQINEKYIIWIIMSFFAASSKQRWNKWMWFERRRRRLPTYRRVHCHTLLFRHNHVAGVAIGGALDHDSSALHYRVFTVRGVIVHIVRGRVVIGSGARKKVNSIRSVFGIVLPVQQRTV